MKKMKKAISLLLAVVMLLSLAPLAGILQASADDELASRGTIGSCVWTFDIISGTLTVEGMGVPMPDFDAKNNKSPFYQREEVKNIILNGVTHIGDYSFCFCNSLLSVEFSDELVSVGKYAFFACKHLNTGLETLNENLATIDDFAFFYCLFTAFTAPANLKIIGKAAFAANDLKTLSLNNGLETIGDNAFMTNRKLKALSIPQTVTTVGELAFASTDLQTLDFPSRETAQVADSAFLGTDFESSCFGADGENITWIYDASKRKVTFSGTGELFHNAYRLESVAGLNIEFTSLLPFFGNERIQSVMIEEGITAIGGYAFSYCSSLESVSIPNTMVKIGIFAFQYAESLKKIDLPDLVESIGQCAFIHCDSLEQVDIGSGLQSIDNYSFESCERLQTFLCRSATLRGVGIRNFNCGFPRIFGYTNTMLQIYAEANELEFNPIGVGKADLKFSGWAGKDCQYTFDIYEGVLTVTGTGTVNLFGLNEFAGVVKEVVIENGPKEILKIDNFPLVKQLVIPDSVTKLDEYSLYYIDNLETICIGSGLQKIEKYSFFRLPKLKSVIVESEELNTIDENAFFIDQPITIYGWKGSTLERFANKHEGVNFVPMRASGESGDCPWTYEYEDKTLRISGSGRMQDYTYSAAPWQSLDVEHIVIGESVQYIGKDAFRLMETEDITIYNAQCEIYLANTTLGEPDEIYGYKFSTADSFASRYDFDFVSLSESGTSGDCTWYYDDSSKTITVAGNGEMGSYQPASGPWKTVIRGNAEKVVIKNGVTRIGSYAFNRFPNLKKIEISGSVKTIGSGAFEDDTALIGVVIPEGVENIVAYAFNNSGLSKIMVPASVTDIGILAFGYKDGEPVESFVVGGYADTTAQTYAEDNHLTFIDRNAYCFVQYRSEIETGEMDANCKIVKRGSSFVLSNCKFTPPAQKCFDKWFDTSTGDYYEALSKVTINSDTTFRAVWKTSHYRVSFLRNAGIGEMEDILVPVGEKFTVPECTIKCNNDEYTFYKWAIVGANGVYCEPGDVLTLEGDMQLSPRWKFGCKYVTFLNAETGEVKQLKVPESTDYQLPDCPFAAPQGKMFDCYRVGDKTYKEGEKIYMSDHITLTVAWEIKCAVTIDYTACGGPADTLYYPASNTQTFCMPKCMYDPPEDKMFVCWLVNGEEIQPYQNFYIRTDLRIEPKLIDKYVNVTFDANGHGTAPQAQRIVRYTTATQPEDPQGPAGYYFRGWFTDAACTKEFNFGEKVNDNITLYAKWQQLKFGVYFRANGHGKAPAPKSAGYGEPVEEPAAPTAPGYEFKGWYYDEEGTDPFDFSTPIYGVTYLYAKWGVAPCTVSFAANGGSGDMPGRATGYGTNYVLPACSFTPPEGMEFYRWNIPDEYGFDAYYQPGDTVTITGDVTATAVWKGTINFVDIEPYQKPVPGTQVSRYLYNFTDERMSLVNVRWYDDTAGWALVPGEDTFENKHVYRMVAILTVNDGYEFSTDNNGIVDVKASVVGEPASLADYSTNETIYIEYTYQALGSHLITFNMNGHGQKPDDQLNFTVQAAQRPEDPTEEGYHFGGWYTDAACTQEYDFNSYVGDMVLTLYAKWSKDVNTVTFDVQGHGEAPESVGVVYATTVAEPEPPAQKGWIFYGWTTDPEGNHDYDFSTPVTEDMTLYAFWFQAGYAVLFDTQGHGETPARQYLYSGETVDKPADLSEDGFVFGGWYTDEECKTAFDFSTEVYEEYTLYAKWTPIHTGFTMGDVNDDGVVNGSDQGILARYVAGWEGYETRIKNPDAADLNDDGVVDVADVTILKRFLAGWEGYEDYIVVV